MFAAAVDGPAGAGKSSVCKAAAKELGFIYVDTGALYRTIALYLLENGSNPADPEAAGAALPHIKISVEHAPDGQRMVLNGEDVTSRIRTEEVSAAASAVAAVLAVRQFLLGLQRDLAKNSNVLMDGRDIGTVVLPDAQLKVFLTASPEERARRRTVQLQQAGEPADYARILEEIKARDHQDSTRAAAPLKPAPDAILLDTSGLDFRQSVEALTALVRGRYDPSHPSHQ